VKAARRDKPNRYGRAFVARRDDGAILLRRRPPRGLLGGMAEVPGGDWRDLQEPATASPFAANWTQLAVPVTHVFTHFSLSLAVHRADVGQDIPAPEGYWWSTPGALPTEALPSVIKKVIEAAYPGATKPALQGST
jgi:A/G-specific adenine glycosylase